MHCGSCCSVTPDNHTSLCLSPCSSRMDEMVLVGLVFRCVCGRRESASRHPAEHKLRYNTFPLHLIAALHQNLPGCFFYVAAYAQMTDPKLMFYLILQSKGEQEHHTSTCHAALRHLTQSEHFSVRCALQGLQIQTQEHVTAQEMDC